MAYILASIFTVIIMGINVLISNHQITQYIVLYFLLVITFERGVIKSEKI
jgi:hypothetical protein